ncbi:M56 family metallopeptidase [Winogradskyella litoriviva]|uniref:M56 family metallopeptidase n=1 Tax=Winogradskyella litoriviva TaxID=1220182 RepID=A0ABX2DZX9_9FLAO|nr:M56 family metallopeptidase [Winogradskyella litoriviva]NRD21828.1 M56 family metallopeptidase [Winogradskyella litoriviva]
METYLLKFSACLAVFWLVYVLFLERQTMHQFKRFYLLAALILALAIPNFTITEYVEPVITNDNITPGIIPTAFQEIIATEEPSFFTLENTLWLIYGFVTLLLTLRFVINLIKMQQRISKNKTINKRSFIYVLLHQNIIPHSYFKYIFFNKAKYKSNSIPKAVMLHEETHAKQLHTLDIILIELLQIVFWFHPLIYILKHHIKLNHEFLADQAVLQQGSDAKTYQHILLQFSSNTQNHQLSSAINYSSIKKRFTVMKTQTSKTRIWLSTILVLPLIAILFFSFAEHVEIEKEIENPNVSNSRPSAQNNNYLSQDVPIMVILINRNGELLVNDEAGTLKTLETKLKVLSQSNYNSNGILLRYDPTDASEKALKKVKNLIKKYDFNIIQEDASPELPVITILINRKGKLLIDDEVHTIKTLETKLKALTKSYDNSNAVFVKYDPTDASKKALKEVKTLIRTYNFKVIQVDASTESIIPPAPPAPPKPIKSSDKGWPIKINGATYYYTHDNGKTIYYDNYGSLVDINKIPPPPPVSANATAEQKAEMLKAQEAYNKALKEKGETNKDQITGFTEINGEKLYYVSKNGETTYFNRYGKVVKMDNLPPPPPAPESTLDFVIRMAKNNAKFFNEGKAISSDKAIDLIKKNPKLNINAKKTESKQQLIYITKMPITINGKVGEHTSKGKDIKASPILITITD